ncbi:hypothetical protein CC1_20580 [Coprococcus catus GD/7]|uniref:Uncharacterized protein n=1 Tax=Coprococcus catus GD/7 TaxID=717962 RepID=D4J8V6_9FIRM|nr:hypothetical protein [Coprococcus catus]CBK80777.1 hypothetical protein CC1_20580 [Coprococcus catus GD/7]
MDTEVPKDASGQNTVFDDVLTLPPEIIAETKAKQAADEEQRGIVKEEDVLAFISDNEKNEFLKWIKSRIKSNGNV